MALKKESLPYEETNNSEPYISDAQSLLPRSGWQNRQAYLSVLMRAKRNLDIAEITAFLN